MTAATARNIRLTTVAMCPVACPVAVPLTTMSTVQQGRSCAAPGPNRDGTLPVSRDHSPTRAEAEPSLSGGRHE
jgi:hypothetical protein